MQETWVQSLVREDPMCCREIKPRHYNYWTCVQEPRNCSYWSPCALESMLLTKSSPCSPQLQKSPRSYEDPVQPKINFFFNFKRERGSYQKHGYKWERCRSHKRGRVVWISFALILSWIPRTHYCDHDPSLSLSFCFCLSLFLLHVRTHTHTIICILLQSLRTE